MLGEVGRQALTRPQPHRYLGSGNGLGLRHLPRSRARLAHPRQMGRPPGPPGAAYILTDPGSAPHVSANDGMERPRYATSPHSYLFVPRLHTSDISRQALLAQKTYQTLKTMAVNAPDS